MTYLLFGVCGPYWSNMVVASRGAARPVESQPTQEAKVHERPEDEWSDWIEAAPKGEVREVIVLPDGTFKLKSTRRVGPILPGIPMEGARPELLIGEIESDIYGTDR